jgi:hypothetical protein
MADDDDFRDWRPRSQAEQRLFERAVADAMARQIDRSSPLPTDDRIRQLAREEVQAGLKALLNTDEVRRLARDETISRLKLIGIHADDERVEETGYRVRRALNFPSSAWAFVKWAGGACFVAIVTALASVIVPLIGRSR